MAKKNEEKDTFVNLEKDYKSALKIPFDIKQDKFIIFSDVHKGDRQPRSDDFERNEAIYCNALDYYFKNNFKLILAGDIEEGWECDYEKIIDYYKDTAFKMEKKFIDKGYYYRIYGNHDKDLKDWLEKEKTDKYLKEILGEISVNLALLLGKKILIVHGHKGDPYSDRGAKLSSSIVRYIWKPLQYILKYMNNRAAENNKIRSKRDRYLFEWAKTKGLLLIAGHTHRGMFESYSKAFRLTSKKKELEANLSKTTNPAEKLLLKEAIKEIKKIIKESKEEFAED